ncbi:MAG: hypothetical protein AAFP76_09440 [Bacteroidota bacterium]
MNENLDELVESVNNLLDTYGLNEYGVKEIALVKDGAVRVRAMTKEAVFAAPMACVIRWNPVTKRYEKIC